MRKDNTLRANLQVSANLHQAYFRYRPKADIFLFPNGSRQGALNARPLHRQFQDGFFGKAMTSYD